MSYVDKIKKYGVEYDIHDTRADYDNLVDTVNQAIDEGDIHGGSGANIICADGILYDIDTWKNSITESQFQSLKAADGFYITPDGEYRLYYIKSNDSDTSVIFTCWMHNSYERVLIFIDDPDYAVEIYNYKVPTSNDYLTKNNPQGSGSLSINRKAGTTIGTRSVAIGYESIASQENAIAIGYQTEVLSSSGINIGRKSTLRANASDSVSIGLYNDIIQNGSFVFGFLNKTLEDMGGANNTCIFGQQNTVTDGYGSSIIGDQNTTIGHYDYVLGFQNKLLKYQLPSGQYSSPTYTTVLGIDNTASDSYETVLGRNLKTSKWGQTCIGAFNIEDTSNDGLYWEIFGMGSSEQNRDNGRALDKNGNEYIKGTIYTQCTFPSDGATLPSVKKEVATKDEVALKNAGVTAWKTLTSSQQTNQYILWSAIGQGPGLYLIELAEGETYGNVYTATLSMPVSNQANCYKTFRSTAIYANNVSCLKLTPETDGDLVTNRYLSWEDIQFPTNIEKYRITKLRDYTEYNI